MGLRTRPYGAVFCELHHAERSGRSVADWRWRRAYKWAAATATGIAAGKCRRPPLAACRLQRVCPCMDPASAAGCLHAFNCSIPDGPTCMSQVAWALGSTGSQRR